MELNSLLHRCVGMWVLQCCTLVAVSPPQRPPLPRLQSMEDSLVSREPKRAAHITLAHTRFGSQRVREEECPLLLHDSLCTSCWERRKPRLGKRWRDTTGSLLLQRWTVHAPTAAIHCRGPSKATSKEARPEPQLTQRCNRQPPPRTDNGVIFSAAGEKQLCKCVWCGVVCLPRLVGRRQAKRRDSCKQATSWEKA